MPKPLAVIIGIAEYITPSLRLQTPVRDAEELATLLADRHDYEVLLRCDGDATLSRLQELFEHELPAMVDESRRVLVYFAAHGMAVDSIENPRGYLVPSDGGETIESLFSMERLRRALEALPCRHLLLLLDCCFAGAFRWSNGRDVTNPRSPAMYRERYELFLETPAWQVITSASYDEKAADLIAGMGSGRRTGDRDQLHSPFFQALYKGLEGEADLSPRTEDLQGDGVITATELYLYLREKLEPVQPQTARQTPGLWLLPKHRKGEYIFHVPGRTPNLAAAEALSRDSSPYRGFEVYEAKHADLFHGRGATIAALLARVEQRQITIVVGSSGTGKSSLVRAGLIPALQERHRDWEVLGLLRPGPTPLATLDELVDTKRADQAVLVIDQLEELFNVSERSHEITRFLDRLGEIARSESVRIVGTMRADLETEMWASPLGKNWQDVRFPLADMTRDELREAIERPAEKMVLTFDPPEMVDRLIDTVVSMPGALPLLSFTLDKLYLDCVQRATGDRRLVEVNRFDAGGVALALRDHADAIYGRFDPATQETMRRLLLRMVTVKGTTAMRRQVSLDELKFTDPEENLRVEAVRHALTGNTIPVGTSNAAPITPSLRLAVQGGDEHTPAFVELAHDAIAHDWPRFKEWRIAAQEDLLLHHTVTAATAEWVRSDKSIKLLWHDHPRLQRVRSRLTHRVGWIDRELPPLATPHQLNRLETQFITWSHRWRQLRLAAFWGTLSVLILMIYLRGRSEDAAIVRAEVSTLSEQGAWAGAQAHEPGQEQAALVVAITALSQAMRADHQIPATIRRGAVEAAGYHRIELRVHSQGVSSLACSPDGSRIVTTSSSDGALLVTLVDEKVRHFAQSSTVTASTFMPDGSEFITGSESGRLMHWSVVEGVDPHEIPEPTAAGDPRPIPDEQREISAIATSPTGDRLMIGGKDGRVRLWSLATPNASVIELDKFTLPVTEVVFSRKGELVAASSRDGTLRVWTISGHHVLNSPPELAQDQAVSITSVDFSADGKRLVTSGKGTTIWDLESSRGTVLPVEQTIFTRFSPDGSELITGSADGTILRWNARSLQQIEIAIKHERPLSMMKYCGDSHVAIADESGRSYIYGLGRENAAVILRPGPRPVLAVAFANDGTVFAGLGADGALTGGLERWNPSSRQGVKIQLDVKQDPLALTLSRDGGMLQIKTRDGKVLTWDTRREVEGGLPTEQDDIDDRWLVASVVDGLKRRKSSTQPTGGRPGEPGIAGHPRSIVSISPRADRVAATGLHGTVDVWGLPTARRIAQLTGHRGQVLSVVFSPDGTSIATTSADGTARLWDAVTGAALAVFVGHEGQVFSASFSHDGEQLATAGADGTIRIYPVHPAGILELACARLRRAAASTVWADVSAICSEPSR